MKRYSKTYTEVSDALMVLALDAVERNASDREAILSTMALMCGKVTNPTEYEDILTTLDALVTLVSRV